MKWYYNNPYFYSVLGLLIILVLGSGYYTSVSTSELSAIQDQYNNKEGRYRSLVSKTKVPTPNLVNLEASKINHLEMYDQLNKMLTALDLNEEGFNSEAFFGQPKEKRSAAYYEIATFVDAMTKKAREYQVRIADSESLSFAAYDNQGPSEEDRKFVHNQKMVLEYLLGALLETGIVELVQVQRESPVSVGKPAKKKSKKARERETTNGNAADYFQIEDQVTARVPGFVDSMAFRISFKGHSSCLRSFLNRLASSSAPILVRSVEVGSVGQDFDNRSSASDTFEKTQNIVDNPFFQPERAEEVIAAARVPIVTENLSQFTVTLEFLEVVLDMNELSLNPKGKGKKDV